MARFTALSMILTVVFAASPALAGGKVSFFAESRVSGERIALDDVARLQGLTDEALKSRLRAIDLGAAPRPMASRTLSRPSIESAMRQAGLPEGIALVFPKKMTVHRPGQRLSAAEAARRVQSAALTAIKQRWGAGHEVRIEPIKIRREIVLPEGDLEVTVKTREAQPLGAIMVRVSYEIDGRAALERQLPARVTVIGPVCRSSRDLPRGEVIEVGDLIEARGELERGALGCEAIAGQSPRSLIQADATVRAGMIKPPRLIKRGDSVTIVYHAGALRITARGEAMRDGVRGDWIPVANAVSHKVIKARVEAAGQVRIQ